MSDKGNKRDGLGIGEAGSAPATPPADELEANRLQPAPRATKRCAICGTMVPARWLMWSNYNGSVCPDCYDLLPEG